MAAGVPVIAADIPALREAGGDAAIYLPPGEPRRWANAIAELASDPAQRKEWAVAGRARAQEFSWDAVARRLRDVYEEAADSSYPTTGHP